MSACARCGYDPEKDRTVQVNAETVVAVFDSWLARKNGPFHSAVTEKLLIICVQEPNEVTHVPAARAHRRARVARRRRLPGQPKKGKVT